MSVEHGPYDTSSRMGDDVTWDDPVLNGYVAKWKNRLGMAEWDIKIRWAHHYDLEDDTAANVNYLEDKKQATIRILYPDEYEGHAIPWPHDPEMTTIHEMLHCLFGPTEPNNDHPLYKQHHYTIHAIARALVVTDRPASRIVETDRL